MWIAYNSLQAVLHLVPITISVSMNTQRQAFFCLWRVLFIDPLVEKFAASSHYNDQIFHDLSYSL